MLIRAGKILTPQLFYCILCIVCCMMATSCATIFNSPDKKVTVHSDVPIQLIHLKDTLRTDAKNTLRLTVARQKEPLLIQVVGDSVSKEIEVHSRNSVAFYSNIYFNAGLGMLYDLDQNKRYTYPGHIYLSKLDTMKVYKEYIEPKKGTINLNIAIPYINHLVQQPEGEGVKDNTGFLGLNAGLDYYYSNKQFLNFTLGFGSDFMLPFPAAVDITGNYEIMSSLNASLSNNHQLHRFTLGYGLSFARNMWNLREGIFEDGNGPMREAISKGNNTFGLVFSSYYRLGKTFNIGLVYKPGLLSVTDNKTLLYEHMLSLEILWKVKLKK